MAGIKPLFITGSNVKIKINNKTVAFATDFNYSVQIIHQTPKVLGLYEGTSVEPLGYSVSGSFRVIRYVKNAVDNIGKKHSPKGMVNSGNSIANFSDKGVGGYKSNDIQLNPADLKNATTFDIEIYQKVGTGKVTVNSSTTFLGAEVGETLHKTDFGPKTKTYDNALLGVAKIRGCRITQADFSITKKGVAMQTFSFVAQYVDEDSFTADMSGTHAL